MKFLLRISLVAASILPFSLAAQVIINFEGDLRGDPIPLDSIHVENLTGSGDTTIYFPDHELVLDFTTGIPALVGGSDRILGIPNPFVGNTDVMVLSNGGELQLTAYDATGRALTSVRVHTDAGTHRFRYSSGRPGMHVVRVEQEGVRYSAPLLAVEGDGTATSTLAYAGAGDQPIMNVTTKSDRSFFTWQPGDELRYVGYASNDTAMFSGVILHTPTTSTTHTFTFYAPTCAEAPTVADADGNVYPVVRIGEQCWMAANLRTTRYSDGSSIPNVIGNNEWRFLNTGAWCYYDNSPSQNLTHGKLYNWYAAMDPRGICPLGWHVPSDAEWQVLESALGTPAEELTDIGMRGEAQNVGGKLKSLSLWNAPNTGATNESGFSAFATGIRDGFSDGTFFNAGSLGYWWTSTDYGEFNYAWQRRLRSSMAGIGRYGTYKRSGSCIRCVQD